jgi:hypothetical protein
MLRCGINELSEKSASALNRVFNIAQKLNLIGMEEIIEDLAKNSN